MERRDEITALCWIIIGLIISIWSSTFPFGRWDQIGPAILPFASGLILILLGTILFLQARKREKEKKVENIIPLILRGKPLKRVIWSAGGMFLSALLFQFVGYLLTTFLLSISLIRINEPQNWRKDLFYSFVFTLGSYILFKVLLKTSLPIGLLGF